MTLSLFDIAVPTEDIHPKFMLLKTEMPSEQGLIRGWAEGMTDRDGKGKLARDFQTQFHPALFELYLHAVLKSQGLPVTTNHHAPDFLVEGPDGFVLEATIANIKTSGRPETERTIEDVDSMFDAPWENERFHEGLAEGVARYSNRVIDKARKYTATYQGHKWVTPDLPYVIALGSFAQVNYGSEYHYSILALLFGFVFDPDTETFVKRDKITKPGTQSPIDLNIFAKDEFKHVAAILFTCTLTLGKLTSLVISAGQPSMNRVRLLRSAEGDKPYSFQTVSPESPEDLLDGLFVLHNPNADVQLSPTVLAGTPAIHVRSVCGGLTFSSLLPPLMARMNRSIGEGGDILLDLFCRRAHLAFNRRANAD